MTAAISRTFIDWLVEQIDRKDGVGELARSVYSDPRRMVMTTARELSQRLNQNEAPWEFFDALEEAEMEWAQETIG